MSINPIRPRATLLSMVTAAALALSSGLAAAPALADDTATVSGTITTSTGAPAAGATAWISMWQTDDGPLADGYWQTVQSSQAESDGTYELTNVPAGEYKLAFSADTAGDRGMGYWQGAYSIQSANWITIAEGQHVTGKNLQDTPEPDATTTTLELSPRTVSQGTSSVASVTVTAEDSAPGHTPTGKVYLYLNGSLYPTAEGTLGQGGSVDIPFGSALDVGEYDVCAEYDGDAHFEGSCSASTEETVLTVTEFVPATTTTTVTLSAASVPYADTAVKATAAVTGAVGGAVQFLDGTKSLGTVAISGTKATKTLPKALSLGKHTITAKYLGSDWSDLSSGRTTLTVTKAKTSKVAVTGKSFSPGKRPTVTIRVAKLNNGAWPTGKVQVTIAGKVVRTVTVKASAKGKVTVRLPKQRTSIRVKALYKGTSTIAAKSSPTVTVKIRR